MIKIPASSRRIFIIGNADEKIELDQFINPDDFIIRFNAANPTCKLKADFWFIANGPITVIRRLNIFTDRIKKSCTVMWRYTRRDVLFSKFEKISISRKIRFILFFPRFKKKNKIKNLPQSTLSPQILQECTDMLKGNMPSSGFLMIYICKKMYPEMPIFLHNFTFQGTIAHNWALEESIINNLISQKVINHASSIINNPK